MRRWPAAPRTSMLTRAERGNAWQARRQPSARSFSEIRLSSRSVGAVSSPEPTRTRHLPHVPRPAQSVGMSTAARTRPSNRVSYSPTSRVSPMGSTKTLGMPAASALGRRVRAGHAETLLLRLAAFAVALALDVLLGLGVLADHALVVAEDDLVRGLADHVVGIDRHLPAAADGVDDVGRHREARGVAAQALVDLNALGHAGAEVRGALGEVALVVVVGLDAVLDQLVHELLHDVGAVVDAGQEHRLVAQREAAVGEHVAGLLALGRELLGVVEVRVDVERLVLLEHRHELGGDALREDDGGAGADAHDLDVRDGVHALDDRLELIV